MRSINLRLVVPAKPSQNLRSSLDESRPSSSQEPQPKTPKGVTQEPQPGTSNAGVGEDPQPGISSGVGKELQPGTSKTVSPYDIAPVPMIKRKQTNRGRKAVGSCLITGSPHKEALAKSLVEKDNAKPANKKTVKKKLDFKEDGKKILKKIKLPKKRYPK